MRFTTFIRDGGTCLGVVDGDAVVDLNASNPEVPPICAPRSKRA